MNLIKEFFTDVFFGAYLLVVTILVDLGIIDDMGDV